jgi:di/tricarboxylate transporter
MQSDWVSRCSRRRASRINRTAERALLYGVLGVATVLALLDGEPRGGARWVMLALVASMVAWNLVFERRRISEGSPWPVLLYWAASLFISEATVKTHLLHIFAKLGVDDRTAAVVSALERGIIALSRRKA